MINQERLDQVKGWSLKRGSHPKNVGGNACVMEIVSYIAGDPWSDHPPCACPALTAFMLTYNDDLPSDADRDRLLKPFIPRLVGTNTGEDTHMRRVYLVLDWLIRIYTTQWMDLVPDLQELTARIRAAPEIKCISTAQIVGQILKHVHMYPGAAKAIRGSEIWAVTAGRAAQMSTWTHDWSIVSIAGVAGARDIVWAAAGNAGYEKLKATKQWAQTSALDLVERMLAVR